VDGGNHGSTIQYWDPALRVTIRLPVQRSEQHGMAVGDDCIQPAKDVRRDDVVQEGRCRAHQESPVEQFVPQAVIRKAIE